MTHPSAVPARKMAVRASTVFTTTGKSPGGNDLEPLSLDKMAKRPQQSPSPTKTVPTTTNTSPTQAAPSRPNKEPRASGLHVTILAATVISLILNFVTITIMTTIECPFDKNRVSHFFAFLVTAQCSLALMLAWNLLSRPYHYSCSTLTISFCYSGSATLLIYALIMALIDGLCAPPQTPKGGIIASKLIGNYAIWVVTVISVACQLVAYTYYG